MRWSSTRVYVCIAIRPRKSRIQRPIHTLFVLRRRLTLVTAACSTSPSTSAFLNAERIEGFDEALMRGFTPIQSRWIPRTHAITARPVS